MILSAGPAASMLPRLMTTALFGTGAVFERMVRSIGTLSIIAERRGGLAQSVKLFYQFEEPGNNRSYIDEGSPIPFLSSLPHPIRNVSTYSSQSCSARKYSHEDLKSRVPAFFAFVFSHVSQSKPPASEIMPPFQEEGSRY